NTTDPSHPAILFNLVLQPQFAKSIPLEFNQGVDLGFASLDVSAEATAGFAIGASVNFGVGIDLGQIGGGGLTTGTRMNTLNGGRGVRYAVGMTAPLPVRVNGRLSGDVSLSIKVLAFDGTTKDIALNLSKSAMAGNTDRDGLVSELNQALATALTTAGFTG